MAKIAVIVIALFVVGGAIFGYMYFSKKAPEKPALVAQKDVDFGPYMAELQRRIKRAWFPPKGDETRRIQVVFKVYADGHVSNLRLEKGSGIKLADDAALMAVNNAAPFARLPDGSPPDVDIQFTFDYNVFKGGEHKRAADTDDSGPPQFGDAFSSTSSYQEDETDKKRFPSQKKEHVRD